MAIQSLVDLFLVTDSGSVRQLTNTTLSHTKYAVVNKAARCCYKVNEQHISQAFSFYER